MQANILDAINKQELGAELRRAREQQGLTQQDAAEILEVARTTITAIESGERRIKASELIKLARAYGRDVGDFVRKERPKSQPFQPQFRSAYKNLSNELPNETVNELEELSRKYYELERLTNSPLAYKYPNEDLYAVISSRIEQIAENVAIQERNKLGLGDAPIPVLREIFENEVGLRIFYLSFRPSHYAAVYAYDTELGGCIAVNIDHPVEKRRWSLAHEYAHFLVHRSHPDVFNETYKRIPENERFADAFARYFLMPTSSIVRYIGAKDFKRTDLLILANYFGVSVEAMTRRLEDMKLIPIGTWEDMQARKAKIREMQQQLGLIPVSDQDSKLPQRYQYLAIHALEQELISEGEFTRFMGVSRIEARKLVEILRDFSDDYLRLPNTEG